MKRLLAMLLCLCLTVLLLASCSSDYTLESYKEVLAKNAKNRPVLGEMNEITQLSGKSFEGGEGDLLYFKVTDNGHIRHTVYNVADSDVVLERTNSDTASYTFGFKTIYGNTFFTVNETVSPAVGETTYKTTVYNSLGEEVATADKSALITSSYDLFEFDDAIYRVSLGGAVSVVKEKSPFNRSLIDFTAASEEYYYYVPSYGYTKSVSVYDKELNLVSYWEPSFRASNALVNYLSSGDVLVQAWRVLPADADEYDFYYNGDKYELLSYLVDPASGEADELELDYWISMTVASGLMNPDGSKAETIAPEGIENMARIYYIENKSLIDDDNRGELVVLGNDAKVKGAVLPELENLSGFDVYNKGEDLYYYNTRDGRTVICNAKGETLGYGEIGNNCNACYFVNDDKIYNHKLELIVDCTAEKLSVVCLFNRTVLVKDENNVHKMLADGELKTVSPAEGVFEIVNRDNGYYTSTDGTALTVYNEYGDKIKTISTLSVTAGIVRLVEFDNGTVFVRGVDASTGLSVYYLIEAASEPTEE